MEKRSPAPLNRSVARAGAVQTSTWRDIPTYKSTRLQADQRDVITCLLAFIALVSVSSVVDAFWCALLLSHERHIVGVQV